MSLPSPHRVDAQSNVLTKEESKLERTLGLIVFWILSIPGAIIAFILMPIAIRRDKAFLRTLEKKETS